MIPLAPFTYAERLYIKRLRAGKSQAQTALEHGISQQAYSMLESAGHESSRVVKAGLGTLTAREYLLMLRRRVAVSMQDLATLTGLSRQTLQLVLAGKASPAAKKCLIAQLENLYQETKAYAQ